MIPTHNIIAKTGQAWNAPSADTLIIALANADVNAQAAERGYLPPELHRLLTEILGKDGMAPLEKTGTAARVQVEYARIAYARTRSERDAEAVAYYEAIMGYNGRKRDAA